MKKLQDFLHNNWLLLIIVLQPILDILSYFQTIKFGNSLTWIIRIVFLGIIFLETFIKCKEKKKYIMCLLPMVIYGLLHLINLKRLDMLYLIPEVKYFIFTFQTVAIAIMLIFYVKENSWQKQKIKKGLVIASFIMIFSIFLAYVTNTYQPTYVDSSGTYGIIGWFSSANTSSMVLCALVPFLLYYFFVKKNPYVYGIVSAICFLCLYTNGTRSCYYTLVLVLFVLIFNGICSKKLDKRYVKIGMTVILFVLSIYFYGHSFTSSRENDVEGTATDFKNVIDNIQKDPAMHEKPNDDPVVIDYDHIDFANKKMLVAILNSSYIYADLIKNHGSDAVIYALRENLTVADLSDNRLCKVVNARVYYDKSDVGTKLLGFGYGVIDKDSLDLENDLKAIFYYYGYIGFTMYIAYLGYFLVKMIRYFFKHFVVIRDPEFIILGFMLVLLVFAGEYSGAFLRKSNANIYLSMYLVLIYFKCYKNAKKENKITFLNLHLGMGGIETATINNANALVEKYNVEIISFYKVKKDLSKKLNKRVKVSYLYFGEPNREEFKKAVNERNIFKILKEGIKAVYILILKKMAVICAIQEKNSKVIVSTRWDFSVLLSRFKPKDVIAIAQEHHHHNNDSKYIKVLQKKYKKIDYLFALTPSLADDYRKFLGNSSIKILCIPNMLVSLNNKRSSLKNKNLISVGRFHPGKRIDEMISIFSKISDKKSKLYLIGDGEEKEKLNDLVRKLKLEDRVIFLGYLSLEEQEKYYIDSSVFLMTSVSEGLPMVLLEAMSHGVVCLAYETESGVKDIIQDGVNGYIIEKRNEKMYVQKINQLLKDDELLNKMGDNAFKSVEKYDKKSIMKKWDSILMDILK